MYEIFHRDVFDFLGLISDESIDLVITDPAYESMEKHRAKGTTTRLKNSKGSSNKWFSVFPNDKLGIFLKEIYRVLVNNSHFYIFCDDESMFLIKPLAEAAGFKFWKALVWDYKNIGMGYHYRSRHQKILFFEKGKRKLNDLGMADVFEGKRIFRGYPTEKPVSIMLDLVSQSSNIHELVCDPFMGSGSVAIAALENERRFIGCDINIDAVNLTNSRLNTLFRIGDRNG